MGVLGDAARALQALRDPAFWAVAAKSVGLTLALLIGAFWGLGALFGVNDDFSFTLPLIGRIGVDGGVGTVLWGVFAIALSAFLMAPVAGAFAGIFADEVAAAVERRAYPALPPPRPAPFLSQLAASAGLFLAMAALNILALFIYLLAPPLAPAAFVAINGWLLGREYLETMAMRRMDRARARALRRTHALEAWALGALMAASFALPFASLLTPLLGAAAATHLLHRIEGRRPIGAAA